MQDRIEFLKRKIKYTELSIENKKELMKDNKKMFLTIVGFGVLSLGLSAISTYIGEVGFFRVVSISLTVTVLWSAIKDFFIKKLDYSFELNNLECDLEHYKLELKLLEEM